MCFSLILVKTNAEIIINFSHLFYTHQNSKIKKLIRNWGKHLSIYIYFVFKNWYINWSLMKLLYCLYIQMLFFLFNPFKYLNCFGGIQDVQKVCRQIVDQWAVGNLLRHAVHCCSSGQLYPNCKPKTKDRRRGWNPSPPPLLLGLPFTKKNTWNFLTFPNFLLRMPLWNLFFLQKLGLHPFTTFLGQKK